jgi:hypothetical protein
MKLPLAAVVPAPLTVHPPVMSYRLALSLFDTLRLLLVEFDWLLDTDTEFEVESL